MPKGLQMDEGELVKHHLSTRTNGFMKIQMFFSGGTKKCAKHATLSNR